MTGEQLTLDLLTDERPVPEWLSFWVLSTVCPDCCATPNDPAWDLVADRWRVVWPHAGTCPIRGKRFALRAPIEIEDGAA